MKEIQLTKGKIALVDDEDFNRINAYSWHANKYRSGYRAARAGGIYMHRDILMLTKECKKLVDHIDGNGLNNQKSNLRLASHKDDSANRRCLNRYEYKGVTWHKNNKKWQSQIKVDQKVIFLGYYLDIKEAAKAYNIAALEHFGEFAKLNEIV